MSMMAIIESDEKWFIARCPEIPDADARDCAKEVV